MMDWKIWLMGAMGAAIYVCNGGVLFMVIVPSFPGAAELSLANARNTPPAAESGVA